MANVSLDRRRRFALAGLVVAALTLIVQRGHGIDATLPDRPRYTPPRTPWGDPDLQGAYTNTAERGLPLERPLGLASGVSSRQLQRLNDERREAVRRDIEWEITSEPNVDNSRAWLVIDPPDGRIPPLVPDVFRRNRERLNVWKTSDTLAAPWLSLGLFERCITRGLPGSMIPFHYGNVYEIVQGPSVVSITYEMVHEARVIPLDPVGTRPHVGPTIRSYMGDARGHFEGETLVIETTNLAENGRYQGASADLRVIERFTPLSAAVLEWSVTFDDPRTWAGPWTLAMNLTRTDGGPLEFACHEGNRSLRTTLNHWRSDSAPKAKPGTPPGANQ